MTDNKLMKTSSSLISELQQGLDSAVHDNLLFYFFKVCKSCCQKQRDFLHRLPGSVQCRVSGSPTTAGPVLLEADAPRKDRFWGTGGSPQHS